MFAAIVLGAALDSSAFAYDATQSPAITYAAPAKRDGIDVTPLHFRSTTGHVVSGVVVRGAGAGKHPAVLFVHWLGDAATTNHTEFLGDAVALAKSGVTSLLIDAMWSQPDWFDAIRTPSTDYRDSIAQVVDLRRSLDVLGAQPEVDASRIAYVGHDFGAMYGAILAGVDDRPKWYVLMAGTTALSQWYLLGTNPPDVKAYVAQMAPLDPPAFLSRSHANGFLFQFSAQDKYITPENELAFFEASPLPRALFVYNADHALAIPEASADRLAWLREKLAL